MAIWKNWLEYAMGAVVGLVITLLFAVIALNIYVWIIDP